jgi:hypothetical protein
MEETSMSTILASWGEENAGRGHWRHARVALAGDHVRFRGTPDRITAGGPPAGRASPLRRDVLVEAEAEMDPGRADSG